MLFEIPLSGQWSFALDPENRGEKELWYKGGATALSDTIALPGSIDEAEKTPLTTGRTMHYLSRKHPYVGCAWYARSFTVPEEGDGLYYSIVLERPHGEVNLYVDGYKVGRDDSFATEHRFFAGPLGAGEHHVVMMIDNGRAEAVGDAIIRDHPIMFDIAHSRTEHTQTNWNGVVGYMRVEAVKAAVHRVDIHAPTRLARVRVELEAYDPHIRQPTYWTKAHDDVLRAVFSFQGAAPDLVIERPLTIDSAYMPVEFEVTLPDEAGLWDEFDPHVHRLTVEWLRDGVLQDSRSITFGIRDFRRDGKRVTLNGRPVFLRGTLECAIFPLTGYPPTDHAGWRKVFGTAKDYGLNHIRYHSWCPPKAAFEVADEMGLLLHIETPVWPVLGADPNLDRFIYSEAERMIRDYGNHPSFVMLCVGNEVHGARLHNFLERFIEHFRSDTRRIYTGGSGWPTTLRADYASKPEPRNQMWLENLDARLNARPLETMSDFKSWVEATPMPLLSHETGQWCVFPNLDEISKYTGVLEARNFEMVRDDMEAKGLLPLAHDYFMASGALQTQLYKEELEIAMRTRDWLGTQLLGLQDFSGQGTALIGVVDAFWDSKPYVSPESFREFCAPVVPLVRARGFVFTSGDPVSMEAQLLQFGPQDLADARLDWALLDQSGNPVRSGTLSPGTLETGHLHDVGTIAFDTAGLSAPAAYQLVISLPGTDYRNRWGLWVFEAAAAGDLPTTVRHLDAEAIARVSNGETLLWAPQPDDLRTNAVLGHTCAFWNTLWTDGQEPHTLGLLNDTSHPLFAHFPSATHSDWHWFDLTFRRRALDIAGTPFRPVIRVVDDWNENRDLVLLAEANIGKGRLIISAMDLDGNLDQRPVARSMRNALAAYATGQLAEAPLLTESAASAWIERITT